MTLVPQSAAKTAFRYAVVEDEPLAKRLLLRLLERLAPESTLVWEAEEGETALQRLASEHVDVLFLDVVFPPQGAFRLLETARNRGMRLPRIVFVTGKDDHALQAFEWAACDYLLKPLSPERVQATLERVRSTLISPDLEALLRVVKGTAAKPLPERFSVAIRDRVLIFRWAEVMYLHTEYRQLFAHTSRGKVPLDRALDDLEVLLGERFVRIHRSTLVNLDYLVEVHNPAGRAGEALMQDGVRLSVSRARMDDLLTQLAQMC